LKLIIENVGKRYKGDLWGLREFSLSLGPGVLGLLGPNGAGKSTLMHILATITQPTTGVVTWNGVDISKDADVLRVELGYLPQDFGIYPNLNIIEFLTYIAAVKGLKRTSARQRIDELIQLVHLSDAAYRPMGGFSGGMRQRVGIAQMLLNDPSLIIIDEPTAGLDPQERMRFRNMLADLAGDRIVILSTHIVSDVEAVATSIALINDGRLLCHKLPEELLQAMSGKVWGCIVSSVDFPALRQKHLISNTQRRPQGVFSRVVSDSRPLALAQPLEPKFEDAYLYFINGGQRGHV